MIGAIIMGKDNSKKVEKKQAQEGYKLFRKGYQPTNSTINVSNPPRSGSGMANGTNASSSSGNDGSNTSNSNSEQSDKN